MAWLTFVRTMCLEWLVNAELSCDELRRPCLGALRGALGGTTPGLVAATDAGPGTGSGA